MTRAPPGAVWSQPRTTSHSAAGAILQCALGRRDSRAIADARSGLEPIPEHDIGENIHTLDQGVGASRAVYNELDVSIREVRQ
jgi:hypothetical protein